MSEDQNVNVEDRNRRKERIGYVVSDKMDKTIVVELEMCIRDSLWSEGAAYLMGFDRALDEWRRLLAPGGVLVVTEAEYTVAHPSAQVRAFWEPGYPAMRTTAGNVAACLEGGWDVAATYRLPESDWQEYYGPLAARVGEFSAEGIDAEMLAPARAELAVRRDHGDEYGYTAYVLRPR